MISRLNSQHKLLKLLASANGWCSYALPKLAPPPLHGKRHY